MTTLKVGIASYEDMKARTLAVASGQRRIAPDEPKVWFTSTCLRQGAVGREPRLLRVIVEQAPGSLDELAKITGKAKSNLSRTLKTMAGYGLVRLERGERGRITPESDPRPGGAGFAAQRGAEGGVRLDSAKDRDTHLISAVPIC